MSSLLRLTCSSLMGLFKIFNTACLWVASFTLLVQALPGSYTSTNDWVETIVSTLYYAGCIACAYSSCLVAYYVTLWTHAEWCDIRGYRFEYHWDDLTQDAWGWPWDYTVDSYANDEYSLHLVCAQVLHLVALGVKIAGNLETDTSIVVVIWQCQACYTLLHLAVLAMVWTGQHIPSAGFGFFVLPSLFAATAAFQPDWLAPVPLTWPASSGGGIMYSIAEVLVFTRIGVLVLLGGLIANHISYAAEIAWCWIAGLPTHITSAGRTEGNQHRGIVLFSYVLGMLGLGPHIEDTCDGLIIKINIVLAIVYCVVMIIIWTMFNTYPVGEKRAARERERKMFVESCGQTWY